jgi:molybdopterin-containing oxidoreductase family iron-sulfur binding subunit
MNRHFIEKGMLEHGYGTDGLSPYEAIKFADFHEGTNTKCTMCAPRVDQGLEPACVITCPTDARIFGDLEPADGQLQILIRERKGWSLLPECKTKPSVFYLDE